MAEIHIFDVEMLRDGGTIFFKIEKCGWITNVRLDTPFPGEPRKLEINFAKVRRGQPEVAMLLADIEEWWSGIDAETQRRTLEILAQDGAYRHFPMELLSFLDLSYVLRVRDYVKLNYLKEN